MDNSRDFRIKQSVWVQAVDVYKEMEKQLKAEKDKQKGNLTYTKKYWQGAAADTMYSAMNGFLDTGDYAKAYEQVHKMRVFLEEALPEINALLVRCEGFREQLNSDSYVEPMRPAAGNNTEHNGGILSLNYDRIAMIKNLCNEIEAENRSLRYELEGIMDSCSGSVDGMQEELSAASAKLNRVANYHDSFQRYEHDMRGLEEQMILELRPLISNIVKARLDSRGMTVGSASTKLEDAYNLAYMSDEELRALVEQFTKVDDTEAMQVVANQIFAKDAGDWSDAEAAFIARTFDYVLRCDNTRLIQAYLQNMWVESYSAPECANVSYYTGTPTKYTADYQVQPDTQMLALLMAQLDPATQGEAYYTLNRIAKMQMDSVSVSLSPSAVQNPSGGANLVTVQTVNGAVQINVLVGTQAQNAYGVNAKDSQVITVWDMNKVITSDEMQELMKLGFTAEDVESMRLSAVTDADVRFVDCLASREYSSAFDIAPCNISSSMANCLTFYLMNLEYADQTEEIESMLNGMLQTSQQNCQALNNTRGSYLSIIRSNLIEGIELANVNVLSTERGSIEEQTIIENANRIYKQYGLWTAVDGTLSLLGKGLPGIEEGATLVKALVELDYENVSNALLGFPYDEYCESYKKSTGKDIAKDEIKAIIGAFFEYQNLTNQIEENEEILKEGIFSQAIQMDFRLYDEQEYVILDTESKILLRDGFVLPQATINVQEWNKRGIEVFLEEMGYDTGCIREIKSYLIQMYAGDSDWEFLINGGENEAKTILHISPSKLSNYITYIETKLCENYKAEENSVRAWFVEGHNSEKE